MTFKDIGKIIQNANKDIVNIKKELTKTNEELDELKKRKNGTHTKPIN